MINLDKLIRLTALLILISVMGEQHYDGEVNCPEGQKDQRLG